MSRSGTATWFRCIRPSALTATTVCSCVSGLSCVFAATGSLTSTPFWSIGAMIIMMMSSTSMTSTSGVTLISDLTPPLPPSCIAMARYSQPLESGRPGPASRRRSVCTSLRGSLLDEVIDELRRRVVHFDVEVIEPAGEVIVKPHRGDRHEETERGLDDRLGDTGRDRADAARAGRRNPDERIDDADDRAEQSDERRRRADRRERVDTLLQVRLGERGGPLNGPAHRVDQVVAIQASARVLLELEFLETGQHDLGEVAVPEVLGRRERNRVLEAAVLQVLGYLRSVELRLLSGLRERVDTLNGHAERPHRHDEQDAGHGLSDPRQLAPHLNEIDTAFAHRPILRSELSNPARVWVTAT